MSQTFTIVVDDNLEILNIYHSPEGCLFKDQHTHLTVPGDENPLVFSPIRDASGTISLIKDHAKVEKFENSKIEPIRQERNRRLLESDWTQFSNSPLLPEQRDAWAAYRQFLRDLPSTVTDPTNVTWPTPPS